MFEVTFNLKLIKLVFSYNILMFYWEMDGKKLLAHPVYIFFRLYLKCNNSLKEKGHHSPTYSIKIHRIVLVVF